MSSLRLLSETGSEESREAPKDTGLEHQNMDLGINLMSQWELWISQNQGIAAENVI